MIFRSLKIDWEALGTQVSNHYIDAVGCIVGLWCLQQSAFIPPLRHWKWNLRVHCRSLLGRLITLTNSAVQKTLTSNQFVVRILENISAPIIIKSKRHYFSPEPLYALFSTIGLPLPRYTEVVPIVEQSKCFPRDARYKISFFGSRRSVCSFGSRRQCYFRRDHGQGSFSRKSEFLKLRLSFSEDIGTDLAEFTITPYSELVCIIYS